MSVLWVLRLQLIKLPNQRNPTFGIFGNVLTIIMARHTFTASIHKEDDLYVATCVEIGTISPGDSVETALANLKEATSLYLEEFPVASGSAVFLTTFTAEVDA